MRQEDEDIETIAGTIYAALIEDKAKVAEIWDTGPALLEGWEVAGIMLSGKSQVIRGLALVKMLDQKIEARAKAWAEEMAAEAYAERRRSRSTGRTAPSAKEKEDAEDLS